MITAEEARSLLTYEPDTGLLRWKVDRWALGDRGRQVSKAGGVAGSSTRGYAVVKINKRMYYAHRVIWLLVHGEWPREFLDHVNHVRSDNRLSNLREATPAQNMWNKRKLGNKSSGFTGVKRNHKRGKKWAAMIRTKGQAKGKRQYLGSFETKAEARAAYAAAARQQRGEFARVD